MKREIIHIDEEKCTGCGLCIPNCPEGALQIIDGKARLISDLFCDGLGACIGHCPEGAIRTEKREAEPYDEARVMINIIKAGPNTIKAHLKHLKDHGEDDLYRQAVEILNEGHVPIPVPDVPEHACAGGCPGNAARTIEHPAQQQKTSNASSIPLPSQLRQWPVQLQLINPNAGYFENADLLIAADCVPFAYADFHARFLKGKIPIIFCPKLDRTLDQYIQKLALIFKNHHINSISIVRMEVPCCGGTEIIVQRALEMAGKAMMVKVNVISIRGEIQ